MPRPLQIVLLSLVGPVSFIVYNAFAEPITKAFNGGWHPGESPLAALMGSAAVCGLLHVVLFLVCIFRWTTRVGRDLLISLVAFLLSPGLVVIASMLRLIPQ